MMLESANRETMLLEAMMSAGLDEEGARKAISLGEDEPYLIERVTELEAEVFFLESMLAEKTRNYVGRDQAAQERRQLGELILESVSSMPVFISNEQKAAIMRWNRRMT